MPDDLSIPEVATHTASSVPKATAEAPSVASPARRQWLALGALGLAASAALNLAAPARATGLAWDDQQALRFLEEVEALQSDFFIRAALSSAFDSMEGRERDVISLIAQQDQEQNSWFRLARQKFGVAEFGHFYTRNTSVSRPPRMFNFPGKDFDKREQLLPFAVALKEGAVDAYHGVIASAATPEIIEAVAALAGIESRHAAALREIAGDNPLPMAFEDALRPVTVFNNWAAYGFQGEALR